MAERQESSSVETNTADNIKRNIDRDNITALPFVEAMTTPFQTPSIRASVATLKKLKEQEREIKEHQRQIQELHFDLSIKEAQVLNLQHAATITRTPSLPPATTVLTETPGPHRLQTKPERPEDIAYRAKLEEQVNAEKAMGQQEHPMDSPDALLSVFQSLTKVLKDNNQHLQSSDVTEPTKFNGLDTQWDDFYLQLRTYLEAKGWLTTFDHKMVQVPQALTQKSTKRFTTSYWLYVEKEQQLLTSLKPPRQMDGKQAGTFSNDTKGFQNKGRNH